MIFRYIWRSFNGDILSCLFTNDQIWVEVTIDAGYMDWRSTDDFDDFDLTMSPENQWLLHDCTEFHEEIEDPEQAFQEILTNPEQWWMERRL